MATPAALFVPRVTYSAILVAAGRGTRMARATPKAFLPVGGRSLFTFALRTIAQLPALQSLILVVHRDYLSMARRIVADEGDLKANLVVAEGGRERQDSVAAGLALVEGVDLVVVHDAARPFATIDLFNRCIDGAAETGAAIAALEAKDTIKQATADGTIARTIDRSAIWLAQTPQVFRLDLLKRAFARADRDGFAGTDEAALVERLNTPVRLISGEAGNRKITTPEDLEWAEWYVTQTTGRALDGDAKL